MSELLAAARAWIEGDPDPGTRAELGALVEAGDLAELASRLTPLTFGTAGLRGPVGAGSSRMNLAVVVRAAYGVARYVEEAGLADRPLVIGFDARPTSRAFAEASASVWLARGLAVVAFTEPVATPLCAYLGRELGAAATVVVTASHNPRGDNGYKVYGPDAVQIVSPTDAQIAAHIASAPRASEVSRSALAGVTWVQPSQLDGYYAAVSAAVPRGAAQRDLTIVHSALHGVGTEPMLRALSEGGFSRVTTVPEQRAPDGTFPTTPFPNPEEPGTLDLALAEVERRGAELLLVNDPDADRLAAAARLDGVVTVLDGNQLGALLADAAMSGARVGSTPLVLSSVVSSPLVSSIARSRGAHAERTHTGFKWLWHAALALEAGGAGTFCFAYEEALGYSVFSAVRDKDGIAAGRALAELAASLKARGATLFDRLFELHREHGLWMSAARNITLQGAGAAGRVAARLDALVATARIRIGAEHVTSIVDYRRGAEGRAPWLGAAPLLELSLESGARLLIRPSGTEPKLKLYGHVRRVVTQRSEYAAALAEARLFASQLLRELEQTLDL
ncbi:MAG: phospho-sugar mutase [Myxococcales bacterium]|nr:MAG: phospho-sugar mutase [Myxococcales bacterium]